MYSKSEVIQFTEQEDVKFIRLAFCDVFGVQKNISIMPSELARAFDSGISFDASAIDGFTGVIGSDMFLFPDPSTLHILPWRPSHGRVVRMYCDIRYPDGRRYENDSRGILLRAVERAARAGLECRFGAEFEFYLFRTDENGAPTGIPYDSGTYMDVSPMDRCENIRREICLAIEQMGISPESSHHEVGPGQNEIDFKYSDALSAADHAVSFKTAVDTIAAQNGLYASFMPKPLIHESGNGLHINMSLALSGQEGTEAFPEEKNAAFMAGIMHRIREMTLFLNTCEQSYYRLGEMKAPRYISWSRENRSQLIRVPAAQGSYRRIELRSPDPMLNPYIAYSLLIHSGLDGIENGMKPSEQADIDLYDADKETLARFGKLPDNYREAKETASGSEFIAKYLPPEIIKAYENRR